jgi:hypothetical protein
MKPARCANLFRRAMQGISIATACAGIAGCSAVGFVGGMVDSYQRSSTKPVKPEYTRLKDKRWAVIVSADREIQGEHPDLVLYLTSQITERIAKANQTVGAAGYIPPDRLLTYLYEHPEWVTKPRSQLATELGVDRIIVVEILEYRLNDPGNAYLWSGMATGTVGVVEADSILKDEVAFEKPVRVTYPDSDGITQNELSVQVVNSVLASRFADRASWYFYLHDEPYMPKY